MISGAWVYLSQWLPTGWTSRSLIREYHFLKVFIYFKQFLSLSLILVTLLSLFTRAKSNTKIDSHLPIRSPSNSTLSSSRCFLDLTFQGSTIAGPISAPIFRVSSPLFRTSLERFSWVYRGCSVISGYGTDRVLYERLERVLIFRRRGGEANVRKGGGVATIRLSRDRSWLPRANTDPYWARNYPLPSTRFGPPFRTCHATCTRPIFGMRHSFGPLLHPRGRFGIPRSSREEMGLVLLESRVDLFISCSLGMFFFLGGGEGGI